MTAIAEPRLPVQIERRLATLRARFRRNDLVLGLARLLIAGTAFVAGTLVLDRALDLPVPFRGVLLALGAALMLQLLRRHAVRPLVRRRTDDEVALLVERVHPELNDELITAVQLSRKASGFHSSELAAGVVAEAAERVGTLDLRRVASATEAWRLALIALSVAGAAALVFVARPRDGRIWFERMLLLRETPWPRTVELEVVIQEPVIARGDDVTIRARVVRGSPTRVSILPTFATSGRGDETTMQESRGEWRATFENVNESFRFIVEGGDFRSQPYEVSVRQRPKLEDLKIWLTAPEYTGVAATREDEPLHDGNLKVPQGTLVRYEGRATEPLKSAEVNFGEKQAVVDDEAPAVEQSGRAFRGAFRVKDTTTWQVRLVSRDGFESPAAGQYQVRAIPDRLPDVKVQRPGRNKDVARKAQIPLRVEVRDDYQPKAAALAYSIAGARAARPGSPAQAEAELRVPLGGLPPPAGAKSATIDYVFDLAPANLEPNDRVTYWVEAVDNRAPQPDVTSVGPEARGKSERYQLHVVTDEELERAHQAALKRIREELGQLAKQEKSTETDIEALAEELGKREKLLAQDRRRMTYAELDQRKIAQRLDSARASFCEIREDMIANRVSKEDDVRWVGELEASTDQLVRDPAARAANELQAIRQLDRPAAERVLEVARIQADLVEGILDLTRRLDKWDEFNEVLRDVRDLLQVEQRIKKDTQQRAKQELK